MTLVLSPSGAPLGSRMTLLAPTRSHVGAEVVDLTTSSFDHVIRTVADLPAPVANQHNLTTGSWALAAPISLGANRLNVAAGENVYLYGSGWANVITSSNSSALQVASGTLTLDSVALTGLSQNGILLNGGASVVRLINCSISAPTTCIQNNNGTTIDVVSGMLNTATNGVRIAGPLTYLSLLDVRGDSLATFVTYVSGAVAGARVIGCAPSTSVAAITWAAANIPSAGLMIVGNHFATGAATFTGFTPADARVNAKANCNPAGLVTETAIVP